jgi:energy-coupling factor transporter transmembrane protein EcfT
MIFEKDDAAMILILLGFMFWLTYSNYTFISRVDEKLTEVRDFNYSLLIRQAHISLRMDTMRYKIDSLYLRNK